MTSRRLAQLLALALAALTYWTIVSRPGVVGDEFPVTIHATMLVLTLVVFGVCFLALRWTTGGAEIYWSTQRRDQLRPIGWMILTGLAVMLIGGQILDELAHVDASSVEALYSAEVIYLLTWTLVPAAFLQFKLVAWPARSGRPGKLKLFLIGAVAICAAGAFAYAAFSASPQGPGLWDVGPQLVRLGAVAIGATSEEVVFRVLLLTALLDRTGSRFQAVFLSSVAFALIHVPGQLAQPVMQGDWALLRIVAHDYAPIFLAQALFGLVLGALWLRTGSIVLIAAVHALLNAGSMLATGF